jgi:hypothetical protein
LIVCKTSRMRQSFTVSFGIGWHASVLQCQECSGRPMRPGGPLNSRCREVKNHSPGIPSKDLLALAGPRSPSRAALSADWDPRALQARDGSYVEPGGHGTPITRDGSFLATDRTASSDLGAGRGAGALRMVRQSFSSGTLACRAPWRTG